MKVTQVAALAHPSQGGIYTAVQCFGKALKTFCSQRVIHFCSRSEASAKDPDWSEIYTSDSPLGRHYGYCTSDQRAMAAALLHKSDFVIVHVPFRYHAGFTANICKKLDIPFVFVPHGAFDPIVFTYRRIRKRLWLQGPGANVVRGARRIIYATEMERLKAEREIGQRNGAVIPWPVDQINLQRDDACSELRIRLGLEPGRMILSYVGRLNAKKRPIELIRAFRTVSPANWTLVIAGPEDDLDRGDILEAIGDCADVMYIGPVFGAEKWQLLAGSDAIGLISQKENFSFVVAEALSVSTPVLISSEMDIASEVLGKGCGVVVHGDGEALVSGLRSLTSYPEAYRRGMGDLGRNWVVNDLSQASFTMKLKQLMAINQ